MAETFKAFMKRREAAALAYTKGDGAPVDALTSQQEPVTFFGPDGGATKGSAAVRKSFNAGAAQFLPEGDGELEILDMAGDEKIGYWTGIQHARVKLRGNDKAVSMDLRITETFRHEHGEWKLAHRHADMLKS